MKANDEKKNRRNLSEGKGWVTQTKRSKAWAGEYGVSYFAAFLGFDGQGPVKEGHSQFSEIERGTRLSGPLQ